MVTSIQLGNIFSSGGKTVVGGGNSGFDIETLVESLADIKRLPAVRLEEQLEENATRQTAFGDLSTLLQTYRDTTSLLRNPPGVGNEAENIFEYRNANLTTNDGNDPATYLSVTAAPGADINDYDISVDSVASYNVKTTETFALADLDTDAVGFGLPFNAGTLTLGPNEVDITIDADDTLSQIVTKINAVEDQSGVRATALQVSDGNYRLQFKTLETGDDQNYNFFGVHEQVGNEIVIEAEDYVQNVVRNGDQFVINADGSAAGGNFITAQPSTGDVYDTDIENTAPLTSYDVNFAAPGRYYIHVRGSGGSANDSLHVGLNGEAPISGQNITGFASGVYSYESTSDAIAGAAYIDVTEAGIQRVNVYAREDGTIVDQIVLSTDAGYTPAGVEASTINSAKNDGILNVGFALEEDATDAQLTIDGTVITRSTNNIGDLIEDVTFELNQVTPPGTEVNVEIEPDTELVRDAVLNFVDAYNGLKVFHAQQTELDSDGNPVEGAVLGNNPTLRTLINNVQSELNNIVAGLTEEPNRLADLGITFQDYEGDAETPETANILVVDTDTLENALAADFDAVRDVFEFNFTSDNADVTIFSRTNALDATELDLNIDITNGVFEATVDGNLVALTGEAISGGSGYVIRGVDGTVLEGLELIYGDTVDATANINISQGIGDRLFNLLDAALDADDGVITSELESLADSNTRLNEDIARIDDIVERYREQQLRRFAALEEALNSANTLLQSLDAQANARNQ